MIHKEPAPHVTLQDAITDIENGTVFGIVELGSAILLDVPLKLAHLFKEPGTYEIFESVPLFQATKSTESPFKLYLFVNAIF